MRRDSGESQISWYRVRKFFLEVLFFPYRYVVSPALFLLFNSSCRFSESCSAYSFRVILEKGLWIGIKLSLKRVLSCHPCKGG